MSAPGPRPDFVRLVRQRWTRLPVLAAGLALGLLPLAAPVAYAQTSPAPQVTAYQGNLEADDLIRVSVDGLAAWATTHDAEKLVPYINGRAIRGIYPVEVHLAKGHLQFHLRITADNRSVWVDLLGTPTRLRRPVALSAGLESGEAFDTMLTGAKSAVLVVIEPLYGFAAAGVVLTMLVTFLWLATTTNIIREPGVCASSHCLRPYNLGRSQMAFWFFLTQASYLAIWLVTDDLDTITPALLGLMGISAGTALSEAMIDSSRTTADDNRSRELTAEQQTLTLTLTETQQQLAALAPEEVANRDRLRSEQQTARQRLHRVTLDLAALAKDPAASTSRGFLRDVLADAGGYSFHRFQIFAWTLVLGLMFVSSVYNNLTMPEFSATLLSLMGLSSGTYIGFKFPTKA